VEPHISLLRSGALLFVRRAASTLVVPTAAKRIAFPLAAVKPYTLETGPIGAFTAPHDDRATDAALLGYVPTFAENVRPELWLSRYSCRNHLISLWAGGPTFQLFRRSRLSHAGTQARIVSPTPAEALSLCDEYSHPQWSSEVSFHLKRRAAFSHHSWKRAPGQLVSVQSSTLRISCNRMLPSSVPLA